MKMFNKLLAVVLSLVMLLSVVPATVFASTDGIVSTAPVKDTITLTLDANALIDALKGEKSTDAVIALLKDAIDRSSSSAFTQDELLLLVPVAEIMATVKANEPAAYAKIVDALSNAVSEEYLAELVDQSKDIGRAVEDFLQAKLENA